MEGELTCRGCRRKLPGFHAAFVGNPEYNLWARESYCSFLCFRKNAPEDLVQLEEEIENRQQEWLFSVNGAARDSGSGEASE